MDDAELFVLASDVKFIPVESMHEKAKNGFEYEQTDVVITHLHTRKSSKVLHHEAAALLREFETPRSWAAVILNYSQANKKDPQELAEEAIDLLIEMKEQGFLVSCKEGRQAVSAAMFSVNDRFREYIIKEKLQFFDDSEVYRMEDESGNPFAFKLLKSEKDKIVGSAFANEIDILQKLDGRINPRLIEEGVEPGFQFIITQWCKGVNCESWARKFRNLSIRNNLISILDCCISILRAYDHLHQQGVLHADIYPRNVLISESGAVKLIDFGISLAEGSENRKTRGGGVCFYFEPEYAAAVLENKITPTSTAKAEQYSIAALLYYLISGYHYLNFSIEREKLFGQILDELPLSFSARDLDLPIELDQIFARALSKDPEKRFGSLKEFANGILAVRNSLYTQTAYFIPGKENAGAPFAQFIRRRFGWDSSFIQKGIALSPRSSVNYGSAGIAYMYYRMACLRREPGLLDLADIWADRAADYASAYDPAFYSPEMGLTENAVGKRSIYYSETGVHLVQALINLARGDAYSAGKAILQFLVAAKKPCDKMDLTLGRSGLLVGCSSLLNELNKHDQSNDKSVAGFADTLQESIWDELDGYPDLKETNPINYFGMAHGWAGILYATLQWSVISRKKLPENFIKRVEELQGLLPGARQAISWPLSVTDKSSWTGWCNGNAGHVFLWTLLYRYFKEEKYLQTAIKTADSLNTDPSGRINNLCCGMAGEAYAFLNLYNLSKEKKYLLRAQQITRKIMSQIAMPSLRSNSLYKGDIGLALLFCEIEAPEFAQMPLFEISSPENLL
jgi:serine/threonine protein kinase